MQVMRWYVVDRWPVSNVPLITRSLACDRGFGILASTYSRGLLSYLVCLVLVLVLTFCVCVCGNRESCQLDS